MAAYPEISCSCKAERPKQLVFRVVDNCTPVLTTTDPLKALRALQAALDEHNDTWAWVEEDELQ